MLEALRAAAGTGITMPLPKPGPCLVLSSPLHAHVPSCPTHLSVLEETGNEGPALSCLLSSAQQLGGTKTWGGSHHAGMLGHKETANEGQEARCGVGENIGEGWHGYGCGGKVGCLPVPR